MDFFLAWQARQAGEANAARQENQPDEGGACGDCGGRGRARFAAHRRGDKRLVGDLQGQPQLRIANTFLESVSDQALKDKWGLDWEKVPEEHACSPEIYQALASYLCQEYLIEGTHKNAGQKLGPKTAIGVWSALINRSKDRYDSRTANPETQVSRARFELLETIFFYPMT